MMKTPEDIKKGLATCIGKCDGTKECPCQDCNNACEDKLHHDVYAYIQQLETEEVVVAKKETPTGDTSDA